MNLKEQAAEIARNLNAYLMIITSFIMIFFVMQINTELDVYMAFLLLLIVMFLLYVIIDMLNTIRIREDIYKLKKEFLPSALPGSETEDESDSKTD